MKEEDEDRNVINLEARRAASARMGGGGNWLKAFGPGVVFIAKPLLEKTFQCAEFEVVTRGDTGSLLELHNNDGTYIMWVHQAIFCNNFDLIEIIRVP